MQFTTLVFLFFFLPICLFFVFISRPNFRNTLLFLASLVFYAWAGVWYVCVLAGSILINYLSGILIGNARPGMKKSWFVLGLILNILGLVIFKYTGFLVSNFNLLIPVFRMNPVAVAHIVFPLGISFFTFRGICYLITVKRGESPAERNIIRLGLYLGFFATVIAGPIDRYRDFSPQLTQRILTPGLFASGVLRFCLGLTKKVIISTPIALTADRIFATDPAVLSAPLAWLGALSFMLQIYFDFSGYTDMAIGIGRMLGFRITENFNFPYMARSIRDFWKRWHITLSTWLRDYLFLPIAYAASRRLKKEKYLGIRVDFLLYGVAALVTFFLCGLWHGAAWTFIAWGMLYGLLLVLERSRFGKWLDKGPALLARFYTLFFVLISWVIFRSPDLGFAGHYLTVMFGLGGAKTDWAIFIPYANREFLIMAFLGVLGCTPVWSKLLELANGLMKNRHRIPASVTFHGVQVLTILGVLLVLAYTTLTLVTGSIQSFIYYKF